MKLATDEDIPQLLDILRSFHKETIYFDLVEFDEESLTETCESLIKNGFILMDDYSAIGIIIFPLFFNKNYKMAQEVFWYAKPEHRGKGAELLEKAEELCKEYQVNCIAMLSLNDKLDQFYERNDYQLNEKSFLKWL